jgi:hypothetical protein
VDLQKEEQGYCAEAKDHHVDKEILYPRSPEQPIEL